jgi:hypothetical protein
VAIKDPEKRREHNRRYYASHKVEQAARVRKDKKKFRARLREFLAVVKSAPCVDCKRRYPPYVMDFDHLDPTTKKFHVSHGSSRSMKAVKEEIAKCELVCANCHRIRTHKNKPDLI